MRLQKLFHSCGQKGKEWRFKVGWGLDALLSGDVWHAFFVANENTLHTDETFREIIDEIKHDIAQ